MSRTAVGLTAGPPHCRMPGCGGQIVLTDTLIGLIALCLLCGREPKAFGHLATPRERARAERDAFVRRREHHRQLATAITGGGA